MHYSSFLTDKIFNNYSLIILTIKHNYSISLIITSKLIIEKDKYSSHGRNLTINKKHTTFSQVESTPTLVSPILPNLLPLPSYTPSARIWCGIRYTDLTMDKTLRWKHRLYQTNFPNRKLVVVITYLGERVHHFPPITLGFRGYIVGNTSTPPNKTMVNTLASSPNHIVQLLFKEPCHWITTLGKSCIL